MESKYPIYIVSKNRWDNRLTADALERIRQPYFIIVEQSQYDRYAQHISPSKILVLPQSYLDSYDTCDDLGFEKSKGPGAARNFAWEHSISSGHAWHWVMDDNINDFYRLNRNMKVRVASGTIFRAAEDFVERYENIAISGLNYHGFVKQTDAVPPYVLNTRIYSCLLIRNDIPYRWRARYNEDTDICLRALKDGWATLQFNAFLAEKVMTQRMKGGNTEEFYAKEGTSPKSKMLEDLHPDCAKMVWKFNRWHHHVDYKKFKTRLKRKPTVEIPDVVNEFGMRLIDIGSDKKGKDVDITPYITQQ